MLSSFLILLTCWTILVFVEAHAPPYRSHHSARVKKSSSNVQLHKRFPGSKWTFYDVGVGGCGVFNVASDLIVALNAEQYGDASPSIFCGKNITMSYQGKTVQAMIMDKCPGCPLYGLDLSRGLFDFFADEGLGYIFGDWDFADESGGALPPQQPPLSPTQLLSPSPIPPPSLSSLAPLDTTSLLVVSTPVPTTFNTSLQSGTVSKPSTTNNISGATTPTPAPGEHSLTFQAVHQAIISLGTLLILEAK